MIATNIHPEATEDDLLDKFSEYGQITNLHLNRSVETGDVKVRPCDLMNSCTLIFVT